MFTVVGTPGPEGRCGAGRKLGFELGCEAVAGEVSLLRLDSVMLVMISSAARIDKTVANTLLRLIPSGISSPAICFCICS
jgi:hypothetical protein